MLFVGVHFGQYCITMHTSFFITWFPVYLVKQRGASILRAGFMASMPALRGILGGVISDTMLERGYSLTVARKTPIVFGMLTACASAAMDTFIATGKMLTSFVEHAQLIHAHASDFVQLDAPRVGGTTPFLKIMSLADQKGLEVAPHFAMEIHLHLRAAYPREPWLERFDWLEPLFNGRLEMREGRMLVPNRPGLGFTLSDQAIAWIVDSAEFGQQPQSAYHAPNERRLT